MNHLDVAIQHGELTVPDTASVDQRRHIRDVFRHALQEHQVNIDERFSHQELNEVTRQHSSAVAFAFLKCALVPRCTADPRRKYYELREIEMALATGMSKNAWLNRTLTARAVRDSAIANFCVSVTDAAKELRISEIVRRAQEAAKRKPEPTVV